MVDLHYETKMLQQHPLLDTPSKRAAFRQFSQRVIQKALRPLPHWRFLLLTDQLANWFDDPHTKIAQDSGTAPLTYIPIGFYWTKNGLAALREPGSPPSVKDGDAVIAIGNVSSTYLPERLTQFFSGTNYYLRSDWVINGLSFNPLLQWLGVVRGHHVTVTLRGEDQSEYTVRLPLLQWSGKMQSEENKLGSQLVNRVFLPNSLDWTKGAFWMYSVTPKFGYFVLGSCAYDRNYAKAVQAFFSTVDASGAQYIVLDLRTNGGGSYQAVYPWLQHLPLRYQEADHWSMRQVHPVFRGTLYVLGSYDTFSAAVMIDDALTGTGLGTRVGEPLGEATGGYGDVKQYVMPWSHVHFMVSTEYVLPIRGRSPRILMPQIPLGITRQDLRQGVNPVAEWLDTLGRRTGPTPKGKGQPRPEGE